MEMKGEERGWRRISSRLFPSRGPGLLLCKVWITRACMYSQGPGGPYRVVLSGCSAQVQPWPHSPLTCLSTHLLPSRVLCQNFHLLRSHLKPDPTPTPADRGLIHCSLSLQTACACWLLCPAHSRPSPTRHLQSLQYKAFRQIHLSGLCLPLNASAWP